MAEKTVCVLGAGSAGMGAVYALINIPDVQIILVERNESLGGTAVNAWVTTWIESVNPPYFIKLFNEIDDKYKLGDIKKSWLPTNFLKPGCTGNGLVIDADALSQKYSKDILDKVYMQLNCSFKAIHSMDSNCVNSITVCNNDTNEEINIYADFFIDASADGVLCRSANPIPFEDYFYGEDPQDRFGESLAPITANPNILNEPSLFFKIKNGVNDEPLLAPFTDVYYDSAENIVVCPSYICTDGYPVTNDVQGNMIVNPMTGEGVQGIDVINLGYEEAFNHAKSQRQYEYWKTIKLSLQNKLNLPAWSPSYATYGHTGLYAPMLGIRESYRINCERMLNQNDLAVKINSTDNLDHNIACGSHEIDFQVYGNINSKEVEEFNNNQLQPSGIPYECLIPKKLNNVLIACRAYGASHIALAARRVNKDMAQLGWAAGNAIKICIEDDLSDTRLVDIEKLQSDAYTGFKSSIEFLETIMK